jgi:hypothetical protein
VVWIEPSDFGLASKLPATFYVGLFLLGCLWYIGIKHQRYLPAALILTISYLYVAPTLIREPVWISNSYYPYGESLLINSNGHLIPNPSATMVSYRYWPLFLYFSAAFTTLTGLPTEVILKLFPLITISLYALLTLLILKIKLDPPLAYVGSALVLASLFIRQQYFGPQAIGYILFLAILLVTSLLFFDKKANKRTLAILLFALFVVTTFTHPLTSFMALAIFFAFYLTIRFTDKKNPFKFSKLFIVATVIWLAYNSYAAAPFFDTAIKHFSQLFAGSRGITIATESSRAIGSPAMSVNFAASWAIVGLMGFVAALSMLKIVRKSRVNRSEVGFSVFNVFLLIFFAVFAFVGEYGAVEAYQRAFMFGLIPLSFLFISLLSSKRKILIILLTVLIFLNVPAQYGSDNFRLATNSQLAGTAFIAGYTPDNITLVGDFTLYIRYYDPMKNYSVLDVGLSSPFKNIPNATVLNQELDHADYVIVSDLQHNLYMFYIGRDPTQQANLSGMDVIYDNGGFSLLKHSGVTGQVLG